MNKIWYITIGAVLILGVGLVFMFSGSEKQSSPTQDNQNVGLPSAGTSGGSAVVSGDSSSGNAMVVDTASGGSVTVTNFLTDQATTKDPQNPGYYYLGYHIVGGEGDPTTTANPPYLIAYVESDKSFIINLLQEPIGAVRQDMERYLMTRLGISQDQMCQLNYTVSVNWRLNTYFSGKNLGFSFCPGATVLPQ